jgi:hypothetical protein
MLECVLVAEPIHSHVGSVDLENLPVLALKLSESLLATATEDAGALAFEREQRVPQLCHPESVDALVAGQELLLAISRRRVSGGGTSVSE